MVAREKKEQRKDRGRQKRRRKAGAAGYMGRRVLQR